MHTAKRKGTSQAERASLVEKLKTGPKLYQSDFNPSSQLYEEYAKANRAMYTPQIGNLQAALQSRRN